MQIGIEFATPGMIVARPVYKTGSSVAIINSGFVLNQKTIDALKKYEIDKIEVCLTKEQEEEYMRQTYILNESLKKLNERTVVPTISSSLSESAKASIKNFDTTKILESAKLITSSIIESDIFRYSLAEYRQSEDMYSHSVRVASFAILLAKFYNDSLEKFIFDEDKIKKCKIDLESIAVAAMLHDIGKLCKEPNILEKVLAIPTKLNNHFPEVNDIYSKPYSDEYSSIYSYLLLYPNNSIKTDVKMMVLLSNEDEIGQGPLKTDRSYINSRQNFIFGSKIIKLCSMYDDELKQAINNNTSLENLSAKLDYFAKNGMVNDELEELFFEHIPLYSEGVKVKLSNGKLAVVEKSFFGRTDIYKPIVVTIPDGDLLDLRDETTITIQKICNDEITFSEIVEMQINTMEEELSIKKNKS